MGLKVTCILLVYNQRPYLGGALASLASQSRGIDELIITDDASTDGSKEMIREFIGTADIPEIKFVDNQENCGINACLNRALAQVTGDVVFLQAGDDLSDSGRVEFIEATFLQNPGINFLLTSYSIINEHGETTTIRRRKGYCSDIKRIIKRGSVLPTYGMAFRGPLIMKMMPLNEKINNEDDHICFAGMLFGGGIHLFDYCSYNYRIHLKSISGWATLEKDQTRLFSKIKEQFKNRRENWAGWANMLRAASAERHAAEIAMLEKKIALSRSLEQIEDIGLLARIGLGFRNARLLNAREWLWLALGYRSIRVVQTVRGWVLGR